jgi:hypothetical protein
LQVELKEPMDLRHASLGPRGYKLKPIKSGPATLHKVLAAQQQQEQRQQHDVPQGMETDEGPAAAAAAAAAAEPYAAPAVKRQRAEGVAYRNVSAVVVVRVG